MSVKHIGSFETDCGHYGGEYELEDGTRVNVVTVITGPGLAADTEIECDREVTENERNAVMEVEDYVDHFNSSKIQYTKRDFRHRY